MKVTIECTASEFQELFKTAIMSNAVSADTDENDELADYYRSLTIPDGYSQIAIDSDGCVFVYRADEMITIEHENEYWHTLTGNEMHISDCEPNKFDWKETHMWIKDL